LIKYSLLVVGVMLTSYCVLSTSLLVSANAVSCYPASMVNLIWFANEKCLSCQQ